jgi:hypothetical protein
MALIFIVGLLRIVLTCFFDFLDHFSWIHKLVTIVYSWLVG